MPSYFPPPPPPMLGNTFSSTASKCGTVKWSLFCSYTIHALWFKQCYYKKVNDKTLNRLEKCSPKPRSYLFNSKSKVRLYLYLIHSMKMFGRLEAVLCHSLPRQWMELIGRLHALVLPQWKRSPVPTKQEDGWDSDPVWTLWNGEKYLALAENRNLAVQLIAHCNTHWAILAPSAQTGIPRATSWLNHTKQHLAP
jgi:hypothetical protein